jgi:tRNA 2-thiouridine synthesizing protein A
MSIPNMTTALARPGRGVTCSAAHNPVDSAAGRSYGGGMDPHELDAVGLLCPLPVLKARKRLQAVPEGGLLRILADDPAALVDIPHFCAEAGHALVSTEDRGAVQVYVVRKGG